MSYLLAGDSTVAPLRPGEEPLCGWGQALSEFVDGPVRNHAVGGATTESFIASGSWDRLLSETTEGDTVVIQFGHNDQKRPETLSSRAGYSDRLRRFVQEVRAEKAIPVLCTSVERRWFENGVVVATHGDYPNAVRDLAAELTVSLIDLAAFTSWFYEDLGETASARLFSHFDPGEATAWPEGLVDDTHFRFEGARRIAAFVARSLRALERRDGDAAPKGSALVS